MTLDGGVYEFGASTLVEESREKWDTVFSVTEVAAPEINTFPGYYPIWGFSHLFWKLPDIISQNILHFRRGHRGGYHDLD